MAGYEKGDGIAAVVIGVVVVISGLRVSVTAASRLDDHAAPKDLEARIVFSASSVEGVLDAKVRTRLHGSIVHADLIVYVSPQATVLYGNEVALRVRELVQSENEGVRAFVSVRPQE